MIDERLPQPSDSVRIVLHDPNDPDSFLVVREIDDPDFKLPGGKLAEGESPEDAAKRELREELGEANPAIEIKQVGTLPNNDGVSRRYIFVGMANKENVGVTDEVAEVQSVRLGDIPEGKHREHIRAAAEFALAHLRSEKK